MGRYFKYAAKGGALFVAAATILPYIRSRHWLIRAFDFPRLQIAFTAGLWTASGLACYRKLSQFERRLLLLTAGTTVAQSLEILPYTRLGRREVAAASGEADFKILTANVLQSNRRTEVFRAQISKLRPDVVLLTEVNARWQSEMAYLKKEYPYTVEQPQENTYGMILYSKLRLLDPELRFLVKDGIPSIRTKVRLRNGRAIWLYGVHPEPPGVPAANGKPRSSGPRDVELLVLAEELHQLREPVVVAGDFNDVAWSHTTRLFKRLSCLLDPRRGRGMFNTFHADYPPIRYPLDHLFHSEHLVLADFRRLPHTGSDHFPIFAALKLAPEIAATQEQAPASPGDVEEAREIVATAPID